MPASQFDVARMIDAVEGATVGLHLQQAAEVRSEQRLQQAGGVEHPGVVVGPRAQAAERAGPGEEGERERDAERVHAGTARASKPSSSSSGTRRLGLRAP